MLHSNMKLVERNKTIIFCSTRNEQKNYIGRDWLKQFGVCMYYDLGCIRIGKSYVKMEEDTHIYSLATLAAHMIIRPQTGKFFLCIAKGNKQVLNSKIHQVIPTEDSTISREPGLLRVNSIVETSKEGKFSVFLINNTNKLIWLRKGSTIGKIEEVKECNCVNVNDLNQWKQQTSLKVSSFDDLKQKIIVPINHTETVEDLTEQNVDLFVEKDTELGQNNMIKLSIDTGNHPPIKLRPYRTPFAKHLIVDKAVKDTLAANIIYLSRSPWSFPTVV